MASPKVAAGILIGGASTRMGSPKALIEVDGQTLIERTVAMAHAVSDDVVLLGAPPFVLPESIRSLPLLADSPPGTGPIGALSAMLGRFPTAMSLFLACDMPNLCHALLSRLVSAPADGADAIVCVTNDTECRLHPCCAVYYPSARRTVKDAIACRRFAMMDLLASLRVRQVTLAGPEAQWMANWNHPGDVLPD